MQNFSDGTLHTMPNFIYQIFIRTLPKILLMDPPEEEAPSENEDSTISGFFFIIL